MVALTQPLDAALAFALTPLGTATFYLGAVFPAVYLFTVGAGGLRPSRGGRPPVCL